jgi:hypothetical protein
MKRKIIPIVVIGIILISMVGLTGCVTYVDKEFDVYITDAPFGRYWVHTFGSFCFFSGYMDSDLKESYTIKFMDGDKLYTLITPSTDYRLQVHFTDDNTSMKLIIHCERMGDESSFLRDMNRQDDSNVYNRYTFDLYIPKPEICTISNEVIE